MTLVRLWKLVNHTQFTNLMKKSVSFFRGIYNIELYFGYVFYIL